MCGILRIQTSIRILLVAIFTLILEVCECHVSLRYPAARPLALDFLDNARTPAPCGEPRGNKVMTNLEAGSNITVTWYLGYAHTGGYKIEILTYEPNGEFRVAHTITGSSSQYVGGGNVTTQQYLVTLPQNFTCNNCTIRLIRQALNWGPAYLFWSCADVNIVNSLVENCSGHGRRLIQDGSCECDSRFYGDVCQFEDECSMNSDCGGSNGECKFVSEHAVPRHQCFCKPGYFGLKCEKESAVKSMPVDKSSYQSRNLSNNVEILYRMIPNTEEIEVIVKAKTTSYIGLGWKPRENYCKSESPKSEPEGSSEPHAEPEGSPKPEGQPDVIPKPEGQPEAIPKPEGQPEAIPKPEGEPEASPKPEGEPEASPKPEGEPEANPEPEGHDATQNYPSGLDYSGQMDCADLVIGKVIDGLHQVRDYYTRDRSTPRLDEFYGGTQSLTSALAEEIDGYTTVLFRKPYKAAESQDQSLTDDLTMIWAHGQPPSQTVYGSFYAQDDLKYHGYNRGSASVNLLSKPIEMEQTGVMKGFQYPTGCVGAACLYSATWMLDDQSDIVTFIIKVNQSLNTWTGIAFGENPEMRLLDVIYGFISTNSTNSTGFVVDAWIPDPRYSPPTVDPHQNLQTSDIRLIDGILTLTFSRLRNTGDDANDWAFSNNKCYYFMFPVGGGTVTGNKISKHNNTPIISTDKICIQNIETSTKGKSSASGLKVPSFSLFCLLCLVISYNRRDSKPLEA